MLRRQKIVYAAVDSFFSPRSKVLHGFDRFLEGLAEAQIPCVWVTSRTRAQLDEPRRRLGQSDPFIGEGGCGVYLPEDYFHLKSGKTMRLGRYTCIAVAEPQPAAAEALEELSADLAMTAVALNKLSPRELHQNTGLPGKEGEAIRMRDFDELFFFAGASDSEIARFTAEAKVRGLAVRNTGTFWSLSRGGSVAKCVRELGNLYDRAVRGHALRIGVTAARPAGASILPDPSFDRIYCLEEGSESSAEEQDPDGVKGDGAIGGELAPGPPLQPKGAQDRKRCLSLRSESVWTDLLESLNG